MGDGDGALHSLERCASHLLPPLQLRLQQERVLADELAHGAAILTASRCNFPSQALKIRARAALQELGCRLRSVQQVLALPEVVLQDLVPPRCRHMAKSGSLGAFCLSERPFDGQRRSGAGLESQRDCILHRLLQQPSQALGLGSTPALSQATQGHTETQVQRLLRKLQKLHASQDIPVFVEGLA